MLKHCNLQYLGNWLLQYRVIQATLTAAAILHFLFLKEGLSNHRLSTYSVYVLTWGIWEIVAKCDHSAQILLSSSNNRYLIELSYDSTLNITKNTNFNNFCYIQCRII